MPSICILVKEHRNNIGTSSSVIISMSFDADYNKECKWSIWRIVKASVTVQNQYSSLFISFPTLLSEFCKEAKNPFNNRPIFVKICQNRNMRPALRRVTVGRSRPTFIHHSSLTVATTVAMEREMQAKMDKWACSWAWGRGPVKPHVSGRSFG